MEENSVFIVGAGTFGTALAERLAWNKANHITLFTIEPHVYQDLKENHRNTTYFPGRQINSSIRAVNTFTEAQEADLILLAVPSFAAEQTAQNLSPLLNKGTRVISLAKGLSTEGLLLSEVLPFDHLAVLKGPTFAVEIMNGMPSAFTLGGNREDLSFLRHAVLPSTAITLDHTEDIRGVELLSILKNAYAISVGIISGRYNSPNAEFLVITKALNEMRLLLEQYGCSGDTVFRYCGIGDLGLTSLNDLSRNRTLGLLIGKGFYSDMGHTILIEGMKTVKVFGERIISRGEEHTFPLLYGLYSLMYDHKDIHIFCSELLSLS